MQNMHHNYVKTMVNTEWSIVRLFNAYGVGQGLDDTQQGMLRIFLYQALNNDDSIKVKGSLDRVRDFVHVKDIVSAFEICLSDKTNSNIFNVCIPKVGVDENAKLIHTDTLTKRSWLGESTAEVAAV